jgi:hypothetical protein
MNFLRDLFKAKDEPIKNYADFWNWFSKNAGPFTPNDETYQFLNDMEDKILAELKDYEGYLNIGRQTAKNMREIYFACKDFRKPSKVLYQFKIDHPDINIEYDIYKDKYWRSFNKFKQD